MNIFTKNKTNLIRFIIIFSFAFCLNIAFAAELSAQTKGKKAAAKKPAVKKTATIPAADLPKVNQVDEVALLNLLKRDGENTKPLLVNFWATWCGPCVEEFPDLVKISDDYQGKIDVITVTLDDLAEINTSVPQFLAKMKATMPAYLLKTTDENAAIELISKDWQGGLPFTILYDGKGTTVYSKQAKFVPAQLRAAIDGVLAKSNNAAAYEKGKTEAEKDIAEGKLIYKLYCYSRQDVAFMRAFEASSGVRLSLLENSCRAESYQYVTGYNSTSKPAIAKRQGVDVLREIRKSFSVNLPPAVTELVLTKK